MVLRRSPTRLPFGKIVGFSITVVYQEKE
jgi:hypothetical protein